MKFSIFVREKVRLHCLHAHPVCQSKCLYFYISTEAGSVITKEAKKLLRAQIITEAKWAMTQLPQTVTSTFSSRSAGGLHDFFSEADYFWPDPEHPDDPYISRDGLTNPDNFLEHPKAMLRFSKIIGALASAYKLTGDEKYVNHAVLHLQAWFIHAETLKNPNLLYAQVVKGRFTGHNYGIIDTIHHPQVVFFYYFCLKHNSLNCVYKQVRDPSMGV
ncbi:hypothetical protein ADIARSV_1203 [Arcticibacter svalbardensis MN12-7]|uniref:Alginate lyase domain-containing protein n=1 Tax=Arcticibacter svalbardensis MN12-7 TaxID=1150600 RepID=R9GUS0_9SPHI|nr:alginate lyase family protein [Arcticibacter svalbardensis]EOR95597.1 hypothetical protein ADIARSV_1203 [Arcticibacter svalbardensis MN12-7]